ncbi:peroxiredoxin-like family protein [Gallaecimonas sp. GXIMD4217]|uniref:peroxiredoxin-like family protein n=1 Tax=Gallaecimonas sp. GXIMD4217 TaxID=3131927 RepID=UPI00311B33F8
MSRAMIEKTPGDPVVPISLPAIDGGRFDTASLAGRPYLLSFLRFASCPFCNLRLHELARRFDELGAGFTIVAVFDSPLDNLVRHAGRHRAPFPILADEDGRCHRAYGVQHSLSGVVRGLALRLPTLVRALARGYWPTSIKGSLTTMPADFLVDRDGIIQLAYYGQDEGDHLLFDEIKAFSLAQQPQPSSG